MSTPKKNSGAKSQSASSRAVAAYRAAEKKAAKTPGLEPNMSVIAEAHGITRQALKYALARKYAKP